MSSTLSDLDRLLERFKKVVEGDEVTLPKERFKTYAITNFRGGIGKSTLAFNLAYELSRNEHSLFVDVCPQRNFSQSLLGEDLDADTSTIYDALLPKVMPGAPVVDPHELVLSVPPHCTSFKRGKRAFLIPGSSELFLFPSLLYTQLSTASQLGTQRQETTKNILRSITAIINSVQPIAKSDKTIIDTSPFFGGGTHLAWVAADALIIPARVDQHSMEALKLTLAMLKDEHMDFRRLNAQAGIKKIPKVHAIVMTHCGWNRQAENTPDRSTQAFLRAVLDIVNDHKELFTSRDPIECIHLLDDFHSAGRISGSRRIPLAELSANQSFTIGNQRLEVNQSIKRYQKELKSLASTL